MPFAVYALALAAFAIGTAEFIISGILPPLADDLGVTIPTAGLLVSVYAMAVAVGGPVLSLLTARFSPRAILVSVMVVFAISQFLCAIAPDYGMLMAARLLSACGHGVFFGAGNVVVARLVPPERRGAAFSLFIGGITVANLLGVPGGSAIGLGFGWRMTFVAVGAFGLIAALVLLLRLPAMRGEEHAQASIGAQVRELRHHEVWMSFVTIALVMTGTLAFATYQVPILIEVTGISPAIVPLYLLLGGVGSVLGIWLGGTGTDWKPMPTLLTVLIVQAILFFTMIFAMHDMVGMTVNLFATSIAGFAFSTPLQARIMHGARAAPNLASALVSTAFNIGIAAGALVGSVLLSAGMSYADIPAIGIVTSLLAAGCAWVSWRWERRAAAG